MIVDHYMKLIQNDSDILNEVHILPVTAAELQDYKRLGTKIHFHKDFDKTHTYEYFWVAFRHADNFITVLEGA
jgi:hypothetical protein